MSVGTPVVATGWSGNLDSMDAETAFLVDAKLVPVRVANQPAYFTEVVGPEARWAEPDVGQAAEWLRRLAEEPGLGRERAERARRTLAARRARTRPEALVAALGRAAMSPTFRRRSACDRGPPALAGVSAAP